MIRCSVDQPKFGLVPNPPVRFGRHRDAVQPTRNGAGNGVRDGNGSETHRLLTKKAYKTARTHS